MIQAINHLALAADDAGRAAADYERVLGQVPRKLTASDGRSMFRFAFDKLAFEISARANGLAGLQGLAFEVQDLAETIRKLSRRGLVCEAAQDEHWTDGGEHSIVRKTARLSTSSTCGIPVSLVETQMSSIVRATGAATPAVAGLDHVVISTRNPERAVALYGGRLGLDFALDRTNAQWGSRFLFFMCGSVRVEIVHSLKKGISDDPDGFSGLAWHVADVSEARQRLQASGVQTSEARKGRRPGSHVLTIQSSTCNIPTIFLSETPKGEIAV